MRKISALDNRIVSEALSASNHFLSLLSPQKCILLLAKNLQPIYTQVRFKIPEVRIFLHLTATWAATRFHLFGSLLTTHSFTLC
jgi:hypothetical protein